MKKVFCVFFVLIMISVLPTHVFAAHATEFEPYHISVVFGENSLLTNQQKQIVEHRLSEKENKTGDRNILCTIFGHNYTSEIVSTITHKVNPQAPRCKKIRYLVDICTRCSDTQTELLSTAYIICCE